MKCIQLHELIVTFFVDKPHVNFTWLHANTNKPHLHSITLHPEVANDFYKYFFNPYINLHLKDFDLFPNASTCASIIDLHSEVFIFVPFPMPLLVLDPSFHSNPHIVFSTSFPLIQINMPSRHEVAKRTNCESPIREPISKS